MRREIAVSIFLKDDFMPVKLPRIINEKNQTINRELFSYLYVMKTNYEIVQDIE